MALRTRICDMLGIRHPILLAGMGRASTPELAAAVSNAGGLGVLGAASCGPNQLREWIRRTRALTDRPFGVDTLLPASVRRGGSNAGGPSAEETLPQHLRFAREFLAREGLEEPDQATLDLHLGRHPDDWDGPRPLTREFFEAQMEVVVEERVPVYAAGLGNPAPWLDRLRANGTKVMAVVGTTRHARQVVDAGVDIIVAQGHDGGGHNSPIGTMALIPQVVDAASGRVPVVGAGGIGDGRGVAAALMLGAEGAWIGTRFVASYEGSIADWVKEQVVAAQTDDTVLTHAYDLAMSAPFPAGIGDRVLRNDFTTRWHEHDDEVVADRERLREQVLAAIDAADARIAPARAGSSAGLIHGLEPAGKIVARIVVDAERILRERPREIVRD